MELTTNFNESSHTSSTEISPSAETTEKFSLPDYLTKNYIIIIIPSVFLFLLLLILLIVIIKRFQARRKSRIKQLETYSSVNYDDESIDEELGITDDMMYTSCRLLVGDGFEEQSDLTNSEPEYDCMSVDVSVSANQTSVVDWRNQSPDASQEAGQSLKTLPQGFWKR